MGSVNIFLREGSSLPHLELALPWISSAQTHRMPNSPATESEAWSILSGLPREIHTWIESCCNSESYLAVEEAMAAEKCVEQDDEILMLQQANAENHSFKSSSKGGVLLVGVDDGSDDDASELLQAGKRNSSSSSSSALSFRHIFGWLGMLRAAFGSPFVAVVMIVYGVNQGYGESVKNMATNYYWKDVQKLQPSSTQAFQALSSLPWDIKPIYGLITDTFPIAGYQRWPYLAICGMAGSLCLWALALLPTPSPLVASSLLAGAALCTAFPDVVTDAAVAQQSRDSPHLASDLQSLSWGSMAIGGLAGCGVSGPAVHSFGPKGSFLLLSTAPLMLIVAAWALPENRLPKHLLGANIKALLHTVHLFMKTLQSSSIWRPALYIYLFSGAVCPDISEAMFFWVTDPKAGPGFSENFLGLVNAMGYLAMVIGILVYNCWFRFYSFRAMFLWTQIAVCGIGLSDLILVTRYNLKLGIPDHAFVLGDQALSNVIGKVQLMPMLVLSAKLCPPGIEGTVFAFLMSVSNLGGTCAAWLGAWLLKWLNVRKDNYESLWVAVLVRSLMRLLPLLFLVLVPEGTPDTLVSPVILELDAGMMGDETEQLEAKDVELAEQS